MCRGYALQSSSMYFGARKMQAAGRFCVGLSALVARNLVAQGDGSLLSDASADPDHGSFY